MNAAFHKMRLQKEEEGTLKTLQSKMIKEYGLIGSEKIPLSSRFHYDILVKTKNPSAKSVSEILGSYT